MKWAFLNLFMMVFWLSLGIGILFFPDVAGFEEPNSQVRLFGYIALGFGIWNAVRSFWIFSARRVARERSEQDNPLKPKRPKPLSEQPGEKKVTDPQFRFDDPPRREGPPSTNGHGSD